MWIAQLFRRSQTDMWPCSQICCFLTPITWTLANCWLNGLMHFQMLPCITTLVLEAFWVTLETKNLHLILTGPNSICDLVMNERSTYFQTTPSVPNWSSPVTWPGHDVTSIRAHSNTHHRLRMTGKRLSLQFSILCVLYSNRPVVWTGHNTVPIRPNGQASYRLRAADRQPSN